MKQKNVLITLILILIQTTVFAQVRVIKGTIKDSTSNEGIEGATILVEGTTNGTSTDANGDFTISVEGTGKRLIISYLGYLTRFVPADQDVINVSLPRSSIFLKEAVVTALGVSKEKKSLGYSVAEVKSEEISRSGEQNVIEALAAKTAGIQVTSSGGTPGASSRITIRGNQTFTGNNQPLIVVDGVPVDNETNTPVASDYPFNPNLTGVNNANRAIDINPDDIESVTILKGPAAAALYGSRAGTGAILYTTKKGKYGKGRGITFGSSLEFIYVNKLPDLQNTYAQGDWVGGTTPTYITSDPGPDNIYNTADDVSAGTSRSWGPTLASLGMPAVNNTENFFQRGTTYTNTLSVTGGTDRTMYRFSYSNLNNTGMVPNTYLKRNTIRLTAEHKLSEKLNVGTSLSFVSTNSQIPQNGSNLSGVMLGLLRAPASYDLRDYQYSNGFNKTYFAFYDNPYYTVNKNTFKENVFRVFGNTYFNYNPLKWLGITYRLGLDSYSDYSEQRYAVSSNGDDNSAAYGQINYHTLNYQQFYSDLIITAKKDFGQNFHSSLTVGNNIWHSDQRNIFSRGRNMSVPEFYNLGNTSERYASNTRYTKRTFAGFYDASIDFKNMIFLEVTGRNEWSSTFGANKNNFFFPGVNMAFVISDMVKMPKWFPYAKIRAAYAESGISPEAYSSKTYYQQPFYTDGYTNGLTFPYLGVNGYAIGTTLGSPDLKPERVKGKEVGAELRFLKGRLNLDVTYYYQKTVDILLPRPIAPSSGYRAIYANSGQMYNKGWEIMLTATPVNGKSFKWETSVSWTKNTSKVLKLADGVSEVDVMEAFESMGSYAIVDQPYGAFYGTKWQRNAEGKLIIGADGMPFLDPKSQNLGNPYPDWLSGIRNTFTIKKFTLSFLVDIRKGGKIWNGTLQRLHNVGTSEESADRERTFVIDGVLSGGTDANGYEIPTSTANTTEVSAFQYWRNYRGDNGGAVESSIEDGGWTRLRDVSLAYRLDLSAKTKFIQYLDFSVTGRNLILFTKYNGVDPETSLTGAGSNLQGFDYFNNPGSKSLFFGIKAGF